MPAHTGHVNEIDFFTVRLQGGFPNTDAEFFSQAFLRNLFPEVFGIVHPDIDHQVFGKSLVGIVLQNEFTAVSFKAHIITGIPVNAETQFLEELFGAGKIASGWDEGFERQKFHGKKILAAA